MIPDTEFLVDVAVRWCKLCKPSQGKCRRITDKHDYMKTQREVRPWENQLNLHNFVHFSQSKSLDTNHPERIQEFPHSMLFLVKISTNDSRNSEFYLLYLRKQTMRRLQQV
jgi:hypothetical protein